MSVLDGEIFLLGKDGELTLLPEKAYDSESILQELLAKYPNLLAGHQMDSVNPRRWLLIAQEAGVPAEEGGSLQFSLDHLFLDQDGIPTMVEVKRSTDTRIRREVVGQLLDYVANAVVYWPIEVVTQMFSDSCSSRGIDPDQCIAEFLGVEADPDQFWEKVEMNLRSGRVRLVFVADVIPPELQRIVEFLGEQMDPAEVFAVEIKQYMAPDETENTALVPRVIGVPKPPPISIQWDEASFLGHMRNHCQPKEVDAIKKILDWSKEQGLHIWWGKGKTMGSFIPMLDYGGQSHYTTWFTSIGAVVPQFAPLMKSQPFDTNEKRLELLERFNQIPGVALPLDSIDRYPSFTIASLVGDDRFDAFTGIIEWIVDEIKQNE